MRLMPASSALWMMRAESSGALPMEVANIKAPRAYGLTWMPVRPRARYSMGSLLVVAGTRGMPYPAVNGKSFHYYTENFSGYARGGGGVSEHRARAAVSPAGSAQPGAGAAPRQRRADA